MNVYYVQCNFKFYNGILRLENRPLDICRLSFAYNQRKTHQGLDFFQNTPFALFATSPLVAVQQSILTNTTGDNAHQCRDGFKAI